MPCIYAASKRILETVNKLIKQANLCPKSGWFWKPYNGHFKQLLCPSE